VGCDGLLYGRGWWGFHDVSFNNKSLYGLQCIVGNKDISSEVSGQVQLLEEVIESYCIECVRRRRCRWDEVACLVADADFAIHKHEGDDVLVSDLDLYLTT
jgi:hypothetical protein